MLALDFNSLSEDSFANIIRKSNKTKSQGRHCPGKLHKFNLDFNLKSEMLVLEFNAGSTPGLANNTTEIKRNQITANMPLPQTPQIQS